MVFDEEGEMKMSITIRSAQCIIGYHWIQVNISLPISTGTSASVHQAHSPIYWTKSVWQHAFH
jgi:hypothetical protein